MSRAIQLRKPVYPVGARNEGHDKTKYQVSRRMEQLREPVSQVRKEESRAKTHQDCVPSSKENN